MDTIRQRLRRYDYVPVLFDFKKPASRSLTETVSTLAHLARFIIADITDPKSIPQELQAIVPVLPHVPIAPILQRPENKYGMFKDFGDYPWVMPIFNYRDRNHLLDCLKKKIIEPAELKAKELKK